MEDQELLYDAYMLKARCHWRLPLVLREEDHIENYDRLEARKNFKKAALIKSQMTNKDIKTVMPS